jgi:hypothetical protein
MTTACPDDEAEESINDNKGKQEKSGEVAEVVKVKGFRVTTATKDPFQTVFLIMPVERMKSSVKRMKAATIQATAEL